MHSFRAVLVSVGLLLFRIYVGPLMIVLGRTARGRLEGLMALVLAVLLTAGLLLLLSLAAEVPPGVSSAAGGAAGAAFATLVLLSFVAMALMRHGDAGEGPVGSHFLRDEPAPDATGWADVEDDFVWLVVWLITRLDVRMPAAEARAARAVIRQLLDEVIADPFYPRLARGSDVQGRARAVGTLDPRHCYTYRPDPRTPGERLGLLVFLHGHGSNYLFCVHAMRDLCDRMRVCLVAPSFGYGNWEAPGGVAAVDRAVRFGQAAFDPDRVFLGGISQGGAGVSRAAAANPDRYAGLIFISPTMELDVIGSPPFADGWRGRPVLVIQGERDANVRPWTVSAAVERMEADGVKVTFHRDPDAGHFLFFAKREEVFDVIAGWAARVGVGRPA